MSRPLASIADAALEPVRTALRAAARADAAEVLRNARQRKDELLADARRTAEEMLATARADGEAEATAVVNARLAQSRRDGRRSMLTAQRDLYEELRWRCRAEAAALAESPGYEELRRHLAERALAQLGSDATVADSVDGGVLASAGDRRLDLTLPTLAERALERSGAEVAELWAA
ncbi:V-type ATP synthase subunit E family protein [Kribbella sp. NPDC026596]|uniref:V-type ATP synthase subunit E family protein n=1 Tax=Kribbella sp. NPDC026596 TaxID=3155122 RepID=UPI0033F41F0B